MLLVDRKPAWRAKGQDSLDRLGWSLAAIDRDGAGGLDTLAIGAVQSCGGYWSSIGPGRVELRDLTSGELMLEVYGREQGDWFGVAVCPTGDVNGDGLPELAVGACQGSFDPELPSSRSGYVSIVSAKDGSVLWTAPGLHEGERFGAQLARFVDVDGDGMEDLLVGAAGPPEAAWCPGRIAILSAATGAQLDSITADRPALALGSTIESAGDLDGDGCPDAVAIGRRMRSPSRGPTFDVLLLSGQTRRLVTLATLEEVSLWTPSKMWRVPLSIGRAANGSPLIGVGMPWDSAGPFGENGGAVEVLRASGEIAARFEPTTPDKEFLAVDTYIPRFLGAALVAVQEPERGRPSTWLISSPAGWVGSDRIHFAEGADWSSRHDLSETDLSDN